MYNVFCSDFVKAFPNMEIKLRKLIDKNMIITIIPWSFPIELDSDKLMNEYFKNGERRYNKYVPHLLSLGIKEENIKVADCYGMDSEEIKQLIQSSDVLLLTGGNPEMFFNKVVHKTECLYEIKHFKGIVIGESAGALLQQERYFITAKNNFYKHFAYYDGFGIINDPFYIDVHSVNNQAYHNKLERTAKEKNKKIYAIHEDGAVVYNRDNNIIELFGNVEKIGN